MTSPRESSDSLSSDLRVVAQQFLAASHTARQLADAVDHRMVIEQAKGALMAHIGGPGDEVFERLRAASQRTNRKVHDVAADLVERLSAGDTAALDEF